MSTTHVSAPRDAGALISFGLQRERPARSIELRRLVSRYAADQEFRKIANEYAAGQGLSILHVDEISGVVLAAAADSVYAPSLSALRDELTMPEVPDRLIYGMIFAGIAAWCFPNKRSLDDPTVKRFTAADIDQMLRTLCEKLRADEMVIEHELEQAWQAYDERKAVQLTKSGRYKSGRDACTMAMIESASHLLADHRLLSESKTADGTWRFATTDRFRLLVRNHSSQLAYRAIIDSPANPAETGQRPTQQAADDEVSTGAA